MKKIVFTTILLLFSIITQTSAQVVTKFFKSNDAFKEYPKLKPPKIVSQKKMASFDVNKLIEEDNKYRGKDIPFRFGKEFDVSYSLQDGAWEESGTARIWSLEISSPNAFSLNCIFDELYLPEKAELYIYAPNGSMVYGPITSSQNLTSGTFLSDLVKGDSMIIQIFEPLETKDKTKLKIKKIYMGI